MPDAQGKETESTKSDAEAAPTTVKGTSSADSGTKGDDADSKDPSPIKGVAELRTHMFAEFAYDGDFVHGTAGLEGGTAAAPTGWAAPIHDALHECSGGVDHATLRPTIGRGLGAVSEMLTSVKTFDGEGIASSGDAGMHDFKRRGYELDSRPYICQQELQDAFLDAVDPWSALESLARHEDAGETGSGGAPRIVDDGPGCSRHPAVPASRRGTLTRIARIARYASCTIARKGGEFVQI